jgi:hypothetical protein
MIKAALVATVCALALAAPAQADFRTDNTWIASTPYLQRAIVKWSNFRGPATGGVYKRVRAVKCAGDSSGRYEIDRAHGYYHHFFCGVTLWDTRATALFEAWQIGPGQRNFRITNLHIYS